MEGEREAGRRRRERDGIECAGRKRKGQLNTPFHVSLANHQHMARTGTVYSLWCVMPTLPVTPAQPILPVTPAQPTLPVTPAQPTLLVTPAQPTLPVTPAQPTLPVTPAQLMRPGIGQKSSCTLGDCLTSRPEGCSRPSELWFSIY